ncbi:MAG TPA: substrate-binding domain-containing protein [Rugosimonospora sp.]|nr:substrate-binding domain-containing protein [Rugosimonospora sp.]
MIATLVSVAALGAGGYGAYHYLHGKTCTGGIQTLTISATPDIAPTVSSAADAWAKARGSCVTVTVTASDPADMAAAVAAQGSTILTGLGEASTKTRVTDVWIPDSSMWLQRLRQVAPARIPAAAPSIASTPVVLAMPQPIAKQLGWPAKMPTWTDLLSRLGASSTLHTGVVDPARDASGLSGLLALTRAVSAAPGADPQAATVALMRGLATGKSAVRADLLGKFPRASDLATVASSLSVAPLTEQSLLGYNQGGPPVPLAGIYLDPGPPAMDYPYAVMPGATPAVKVLAESLRTALSTADFRNRLAAANLRGPGGTFGTGASLGTGTPAGPLPAGGAVDPRLAEQVLSTWSAVTQPGRLLAVIDVSGSMLTPVPTAGGLTREQVTVKAAAQGLSLFDDNWSVGLWVFSTDMDGTKPYRVLSPIVPLAGERTRLQGVLNQVAPKKNGNTGLYDTALAAYKAVQQDWDPGRSNGLVIMTDGQNDNPGGLTLDQLTAQLQKVVDPNRPIQVILIGIGPEADKGELTKIAQAAQGGGAFVAPDPSKIGQIFLQAIALRPRTGG